MTRTGKARTCSPPSPSRSWSCTPRDAARFGVDDGELVLVRSRRGRATLRARVSDARARGRRVRAVPLGRAAPAPGAGALNGVVDPRHRPDQPPGRAEGQRRARRAAARPRRGSAPAAARAGGWSSSAAGWRAWRPWRRCSRTTTPTALGDHDRRRRARAALQPRAAVPGAGRSRSPSTSSPLRHPALVRRPRRDAARSACAARLIDPPARAVELADGERWSTTTSCLRPARGRSCRPCPAPASPACTSSARRADARAILAAAERRGARS